MTIMKYIITLLLLSHLSLFSQGWVQTAELDTVWYRQILSSDESTYLFTNHTYEISVLKSGDDGISWDTLVDGNPFGYEKEFPTVSDLIAEDVALVCMGSKGNIFKYNFINKSVENIKLETTNFINSIKMLDENNGICGTEKELFITEDGWKTNRKIIVNKLEEVYINKLNNKLEYYYITSNEFNEHKSRLYWSQDMGETWVESLIGEVRALDLDVKKDGTIFITASKYTAVDEIGKYSDLIYKSTDNGTTWQEKLNFTFDERVDLDDINFYNDQIGMACGQNTSTYLTFDGGDTWQKQNVGEVEELTIRPTFGGFTQTKFILAVWNEGIFENKISTASVRDVELSNKYEYTLVDNILSFEKPQNIDYEIFNLAGQKLLQGATTDSINLNQIGRGVFLIRINNEYTVKVIL